MSQVPLTRAQLLSLALIATGPLTIERNGRYEHWTVTAFPTEDDGARAGVRRFVVFSTGAVDIYKTDGSVEPVTGHELRRRDEEARAEIAAGVA